MRILVTGASGFAGSLLVPRLLSDGHEVCALARDQARVITALEDTSPEGAEEVEVLRGDAVSGDGLDRALARVDVAYYLIHSMESAAEGAFPERERIAAENFASAATRANVGRIVYLGGVIGDASARSAHLKSRQKVERILLEAVPGSVALRASIVIGARSRSFRFLVRLVERLPVLTLPAWRSFRTQPIDERDIIEMLTASATAAAVSGRSLDVGGPDILTYEEMISRIAGLMLIRRPVLGLAVNITPVASRIAAAITAEDPELILALMESLQGDLLMSDDHAAGLLGVELHSFDSAVEHALRVWEQSEPLAAR
ncbi:MAG: NAD(P)H-binding protein [Solirubrobacterales bacterium]